MVEQLPIKIQFLSGKMGDPAALLVNEVNHDHILFDLGTLDHLSNRELLKIKHIFVSHTHIDHFIGFDRLLRVHLPHFKKLSLYGPPGFIEQVSYKLKGYTWNLLSPAQIEWTVYEAHPGKKVHALLSSDRQFEIGERVTGHGPLYQGEDLTIIEAQALDHGIPSMAYRYLGPKRYGVKKDALKALGLTPGPWIKNMQKKLARAEDPSTVWVERDLQLKKEILLEEVFYEKPRIAVGYVTDAVFSKENVMALQKAFSPLETLICEASFRDDDFKRAHDKKHLTTRQAALIAALLKASRLEVFHISNIYGDDYKTSEREAERFFSEFRTLSHEALEAQLDLELKRVSDSRV